MLTHLLLDSKPRNIDLVVLAINCLKRLLNIECIQNPCIIQLLMWKKAGHKIKIAYETYLHSKKCDSQLERAEDSSVSTFACFNLVRFKIFLFDSYCKQTKSSHAQKDLGMLVGESLDMTQ